MITKEFKKLKVGDTVLLYSGLQGEIGYFAKFLRNRMWAASDKKNADGIYFEGEDDDFYVHRRGIRRALGGK